MTSRRRILVGATVVWAMVALWIVGYLIVVGPGVGIVVGAVVTGLYGLGLVVAAVRTSPEVTR